MMFIRVLKPQIIISKSCDFAALAAFAIHECPNYTRPHQSASPSQVILICQCRIFLKPTAQAL
jgi:hypothetical protein